MPVSTEDDWSDSDDEASAGMETDVLLGVPDGSVDSDADIKDAAVSRIGGLPAFLPSREPPFSSSQCKVCSDPMELLLQVWCPFEESLMDRALYVWGCARSTCQRQAGSIRAWRGLRHNAIYAAKMQKKKTRDAGKQVAIASPPVSGNPFSMTSTGGPTMFGLGDQIFGNPATDIPDLLKQDHDDHSDAESDHSSSSEDSLVTAMTLAKVEESFWSVAPSYPAIYLSTLSEYIPQPSNTRASARIEEPVEADDKAGKSGTWALETYENSLEMDNVFDRFVKRVGFTGEQCLRYELGGVPLPFASDQVFEQLFPAAPPAPLPVTKAVFEVVQPRKRSYSTASIPPCPCCNSSRVFECQLMPNLINVLRVSVDDEHVDVRRLPDEQRIKAVQDTLKEGRRGMEWGTCMVFSCGKDCCVDEKECWREEYVLVQWDE